MGQIFVRASARAKSYVRRTVPSGEVRAGLKLARKGSKETRIRNAIRKIKGERMMYGNVFQPGAGKSHLIQRVKQLNSRQSRLVNMKYFGK